MNYLDDNDSIYQIMDAWKADFRKAARIENLRNQVMNARTFDEVDSIVSNHIELVESNDRIRKMISNAYHRIEVINRTKRRVTPISEMN